MDLQQIKFSNNSSDTRIYPGKYNSNGNKFKLPENETIQIMFTTSGKRSTKIIEIGSNPTSSKRAFDSSPMKLDLIDSNNNNTSHKRAKISAEPDKELFTRKVYKCPIQLVTKIYDNIIHKLKNAQFRPVISYNSFIQHKKGSCTRWTCTYHVKWPEECFFKETSSNKKKAANETAFSLLLSLRDANLIDRDGCLIKTNLHLPKAAPKPASNIEIPAKNKDIVWSCTYNLKWPELRQEGAIKPTKSPPELLLTENQIETLAQIAANYENYLKVAGIKQEREARPALAPTKPPKSSTIDFLGAEAYLAPAGTKLPISGYKADILALVAAHPVVIIKGAPGCGKSTRVPQFLLESWAAGGPSKHFKVAVTQPRRIAAISLAERVAEERGEACGRVVGYQIRLKANFSQQTGRILYCTNGILLRCVQGDPSLANYSHIVVDEAHERDANTDLLLLLLKTALKLNNALKVIVMSATIDTSVFVEYFKAPVLNVPGFTYPVKSYFLDDLGHLRLTESWNCSVCHDNCAKVIKYIDECRGPGAILCFLPGWCDILKVEALIVRCSKMRVFRLHSKVHADEQKQVFTEIEHGIRKVVLSTNIAETSVTINDVVYVIDAGIHKESRYDAGLEVNCVDNRWISQASMVQRKGRAGRVQPGESFHLYTKLKYEQEFAKFGDPELLRISLTKIALDAKIYCEKMKINEFMAALLTPPDHMAVSQAICELKALDLIDDDECLTEIGGIVARYQMHPRLAKILIKSVIYKCVSPIVDLVTLYSEEIELFSSSLTARGGVREVKEQMDGGGSDFSSVLLLLEDWHEKMAMEGEKSAKSYCKKKQLLHENVLKFIDLQTIHENYLFHGLYRKLSVSHDDCDLFHGDEFVSGILFSGLGNILKTESLANDGKCVQKKRLVNHKNQVVTINQESINFKNNNSLMVYINEVRSNERKINTVRDCSTIKPLTALLFAENKVLITEKNEEDVIIKLAGTKLEFSTNKIIAYRIEISRNCLKQVSDTLLQNVLDTGHFNLEISNIWNEVLEKLSMALEVE